MLIARVISKNQLFSNYEKDTTTTTTTTTTKQKREKKEKKRLVIITKTKLSEKLKSELRCSTANECSMNY